MPLVALIVLIGASLWLLAGRLMNESPPDGPLHIGTPTSPVVQQATVTPTEAVETETPTSDSSFVVVLIPTPTPDTWNQAQAQLTIPTPEASTLELVPRQGDVGWWQSEGHIQANIGDSFLYAGIWEQQTYIAAARFDLSRVPRGAEIRGGTLRLTGLRDERLRVGVDTGWMVQFIAENELATLAEPRFLTIYSAPASITLFPPLAAADLAVGSTNEWQLNENVRAWLAQQVVDGATSVIVRILPLADDGDSLFAWDSGQGPESARNGPRMVLSLGPPPPTPPPFPTREVVVATLTPTPDNVLTVVAQAETATSEAITIGTRTPIPYEVWTPTPRPENLETVQANAIIQGLPPVVLHTPIPANAATAVSLADYATAVALTTGTFTPVPTGYVTPVLIYPSPPAENIATAAARVVMATAQAQSGIAVPTLPWNAWEVEYIYATPIPENVATAVALNRELNDAILTTGTPTATPGNLVVITRVPPPPEPTPTPIPLVIPADQIAATPTPTPTRLVTGQDFDEFRNKILFQSDRTGTAQTWVLDPITGQVVGLVTESQLYQVARELMLPHSPSGGERAIVQEDIHRNLQIKVYSIEYNTARQITHFNQGMSYDPAWSPRGDQIAFVSNVSGGDEIYIVDPAGENIERLTHNTWEWDKHPSWSPDGAQIVFMSNRDSGHMQIWIMNADGSEQRNLTNDEYDNWDPVWIR